MILAFRRKAPCAQGRIGTMVEFRVVHSVTTEMCTGFLTLASFGVILKFLSDGYTKHFFGKVNLFDKIAMLTSRYSEPASYFALFAGIAMTFVSMVTGSLSWTVDQLLASELVHNKILLTVMSQTLFIGALILRAQHRYELWMQRMTAWIYTLMTVSAFAFIILQNSVAGQMVGKGSLLDDTFPWLKDIEFDAFIMPVWASVLIIICTIVFVGTVAMNVRGKGKVERLPPAPT